MSAPPIEPPESPAPQSAPLTSASPLSEPLVGSGLGEGDESTILLHGFLGSGRNLRGLAVRWQMRQPGRRFWLPDLPGHGDSPPLALDDSVDHMAVAVLESADRLGLARPFSLVGHSLGGRVALAAARVAPDRLREVVLLDIAPGPIDAQRSESRRILDVMLQAPAAVADRRILRAFLIERQLSPALADWVLMNVRSDGDRYVWRVDRQRMDALHEAFNKDDLWPVVEAKRVPIRCIRGGRSHYVSEADVARFARAGVMVATLPGAGHFIHMDASAPLVEWLCGADVTQPLPAG